VGSAKHQPCRMGWETSSRAEWWSIYHRYTVCEKPHLDVKEASFAANHDKASRILTGYSRISRCFQNTGSRAVSRCISTVPPICQKEIHVWDKRSQKGCLGRSGDAAAQGTSSLGRKPNVLPANPTQINMQTQLSCQHVDQREKRGSHDDIACRQGREMGKEAARHVGAPQGGSGGRRVGTHLVPAAQTPLCIMVEPED